MNAAVQFDTLPERTETRRGLIAVAMSGGVDSSAVAALLQQQGRPVVGLTMQLWNQRRLPELQGDGPAQHRCCSLDDVYDAKAVAQHLNFPHYVVNFELATGHYARIRTNDRTGRWELLRALDDSKDQSYFLWGLSQEQLSRSDFPLGELSKDEVRALARRANLPVAEKPESMELCFVPTGNYVQFIQAYSRERGISLQNGEGEIVSENGDVIGHHNGVHNFTIGQRKGLGFAAGKPLYVLSIDPEKNRIVVGEDDVLRKTVCEVEGVNWISCEKPAGPIRAFAKIRHKHEPAPATIQPLDPTTAKVTFDAPQRAITPGQAAVFYKGDVVLGGGWIR